MSLKKKGKKSNGKHKASKSTKVYWGDVKPDEPIHIEGAIYKTRDGRTIFWHGGEVRNAQKHLDRQVLDTRPPPKRGIEWKDVRYASMPDPTGQGKKKFDDWFAFKNKKGHWYEVFTSVQGSVTGMYRTHSKKDAMNYFTKNKKAIGIQRYDGSLTAGLVEVWPNKIKHKGKTYRRAYQGPHDRKFATNVAKELTDSGTPSIVRRVDRGYLIYYEE
jgi:hypothetical protein